MKIRHLGTAFFIVGAISMLLMSFHYLIGEDSGILKGKVLQDIHWYRTSLRAHILMGIAAIFIGPFQLIPAMVRKRPRLHRTLGYMYTLAVASSALTGLNIAQHAMGGMITRIGFSLLALLWLGSLVYALLNIRKRNIRQHQKGMLINYALTFAAITQRTLLLFAFLPAFDFMPIYQLSAWLPWMFNVSIALYLIKDKKSYEYMSE